MKRLLFTMFVVLLLSITVCAHSGGTDSKGGHYNRSTGEYHYHHGKPAHDHPGGVCPYTETAKAPVQRSAPSSSEPQTKEDESFDISSALVGASVPVAGYAAVKAFINHKKGK